MEMLNRDYTFNVERIYKNKEKVTFEVLISLVKTKTEFRERISLRNIEGWATDRQKVHKRLNRAVKSLVESARTYETITKGLNEYITEGQEKDETT